MASDTHTLGVTPGLPLPAVRAVLRDVDRHLPDRARETLALLSTVPNAVRHGEPPAELEVTWLAGMARLVVRSGGPRFRWHGPPPAGKEGGWGLVLVNRMPTAGGSSAVPMATKYGSRWTTRPRRARPPGLRPAGPRVACIRQGNPSPQRHRAGETMRRGCISQARDRRRRRGDRDPLNVTAGKLACARLAWAPARSQAPPTRRAARASPARNPSAARKTASASTGTSSTASAPSIPRAPAARGPGARSHAGPHRVLRAVGGAGLEPATTCSYAPAGLVKEWRARPPAAYAHCRPSPPPRPRRRR